MIQDSTNFMNYLELEQTNTILRLDFINEMSRDQIVSTHTRILKESFRPIN